MHFLLFHRSRVVITVVTFVSISLLSACGGQATTASNGSGGGSGSSGISVAISPAQASVTPGSTQQFTATVKGTPNTAVTWQVNGVTGGNATIGIITAKGFYTAPPSVPSGPITVSALSQADTTDSAKATVTIDAVTITPSSATLQTGLSEQFTAVVYGSSNQAVTWLVNGVVGGNSANGSISSSGDYTAPQTAPSAPVSVEARSTANPSDSATAMVLVVSGPPVIKVTVTPGQVSLAGDQTQQFAATVTGTSNQAVNWLVNNIPGGNTSVGTITSSGLYTAPICSHLGNGTVTATSQYDGNASANALVTILNGSSNGNYYVATYGSDSNDGSACHPWQTISHAMGYLSPGVNIHVQPGTYNEAVQVTGHGTASAPITIISDMQWAAQIAPTSAPLAAVLIGSYSSGDGDYVDFVGFDVTGAPANGILTYGSHDRILGNRVHDLLVPCNGNGGSGINSQNIDAGYNEISGNIVHDVKPPNGCGQHHGSGIYFLNPYGIAYNNIVYQNGQTGIQQWHAASNGIIANNLIFNNADTGLLVGCGDSGCVLDDYTSVDNNMVFNNGNWGLRELDYCSGCDIGTHNVYNNNIVYGNSPGNASILKGTVKNLMTIDPSQGTLFVDWQTDGSGDYHLKTGSPAIDAGTTSCASGVTTCVPAIDHEGGSRPFGPSWDVGAYEWGSTPGLWPWWKF